MFRIQVWTDSHWKWGIREYKTEEDAKKRVEELKKVGIKARVRTSYELFN